MKTILKKMQYLKMMDKKEVMKITKGNHGKQWLNLISIIPKITIDNIINLNY